MTDISLPYSARPTRRGRTSSTGAIGLRRFAHPRTDGRYSIDIGKLRKKLDDSRAGRLASVRREFATGFVDFLLGRGARHP
jgi:hypothetical protein